MDIVVVGFIYPVVIFFIVCVGLWIAARKDQNRTSRLEKMVGVFLVWFILNGLFLMYNLVTLWYEPSPFSYGWIALDLSLPMAVLMTIPFIYDLAFQLRQRKSKEITGPSLV